MLVIPEAFPETAQKRAQRCNEAATKRFLMGQQRKNFLNRCTSAGSRPGLTPDQQKLKNCNDVPKGEKPHGGAAQEPDEELPKTNIKFFDEPRAFAMLETIEFTGVRVPIAPPRSLQNVALMPSAASADRDT
jgi:hypothetical protein